MLEAIERGRIRCREHALVERDFSGLRWGAITPTDIDAYIEFGDRLFIFVESKFSGARFGGGQMLGLQRLVDGLHKPPMRHAACLVIDQAERTELVDYATCMVRTYRWGGQWRRPMHAVTCRQAIDRLLALSGVPRVVKGASREAA